MYNTETGDAYETIYRPDNSTPNQLFEFDAIPEHTLPFFRIPKELNTSDKYRGISVNAKFLYGILLDRQTLSKKNGWRDQCGNIYIFATLNDVRKTLQCSEKTAVKVLKELENCDLIRKVRRGFCMPNLIYVKDLISTLSPDI